MALWVLFTWRYILKSVKSDRGTSNAVTNRLDIVDRSVVWSIRINLIVHLLILTCMSPALTQDIQCKRVRNSFDLFGSARLAGSMVVR